MISYCVTQTIPDVDLVSAMVICPEDVVAAVLAPFQLLAEKVTENADEEKAQA